MYCKFRSCCDNVSWLLSVVKVWLCLLVLAPSFEVRAKRGSGRSVTRLSYQNVFSSYFDLLCSKLGIEKVPSCLRKDVKDNDQYSQHKEKSKLQSVLPTYDSINNQQRENEISEIFEKGLGC